MEPLATRKPTLVATRETSTLADALRPDAYRIVVHALGRTLTENVNVASAKDTVLSVVLEGDQFVTERRSAFGERDAEAWSSPARAHESARNRLTRARKLVTGSDKPGSAAAAARC
jgi:hypothetical protein